jgi:hypothetical protein
MIATLYSSLVSRKVTDHVSVITTIGSGILLTDRIDLEEDYLRRLSDDGEIDHCNRKYHRIYYGDEEYINPDSFIKDTYIPGVDDWPKTRRAILARLSSFERRDLLLRGLDLVTFRRFCDTRGNPDLSSDERNVLKHCTKELSPLRPEKVRIIQDVYYRLMGDLSL